MRIACVSLPEFPLQLLLRKHPDWSEHPVAVVDRDVAQGVILWSNERARACRVLPGLRYAATLSLSPDLRAGEVPSAEIQAAVASLTESLRFYTPDVEPSTGEPGVFWLGASGMSLLYPSLRKWARWIVDEVAREGLRASVVVGFSRFGTYAIARANPKPHADVINTEAEEREHASTVPLNRLGIDPNVRDTLHKLGVNTLGEFLALPANGVRTRFGAEIHRMHRVASGELASPLQPQPTSEPVLSSVHLDYPENDLERLMAVIDRSTRLLARTLDERGHVLRAITIQLEFDDRTKTAERLEPASPTLDLGQVADLIRLRLTSVLAAHSAGTTNTGARKISAGGVTGIRVELDGVAARSNQPDFFDIKPRRDSAAAARALARVRAELGENAVVKPVLRDGHLPEARFEWEPVTSLAAPQPRAVRHPPLVRRIFARPIPFSPGRHRDAEGELLKHIDEGTVRETFGPYIVAGGWWSREVRREYYFVRTSNGRALWMYYDRRRMSWFIQGEVE
ncbi:MAG TPA: DNA polymerase Y family protein [Candidatus Krumholzibacteria bacterium]|nr:DNA polymerase Y family protein [Candidatus Krumholzibacteria bacterium]